MGLTFKINNQIKSSKEEPELLSTVNLKGTHQYVISPNARIAKHSFSNFNTPEVSEWITLPENKVLNNDKSISKNINYAEAFYNSALAFSELKEPEAATISFLRALELDPNLPYLLGSCLNNKLNILYTQESPKVRSINLQLDSFESFNYQKNKAIGKFGKLNIAIDIIDGTIVTFNKNILTTLSNYLANGPNKYPLKRDAGLLLPSCCPRNPAVPSVPHRDLIAPDPPGCWSIHFVKS